MGGTTERIRDAQGHKWPITGYWCDMCGMPLHRILRAVGVHPTCEVQHAPPGSGGGTQSGEDVGAPDTPILATFTPPSQPKVPSDDVDEDLLQLDSCAPSVKRLRVQIITDVAANPDSLAKEIAKRLGERRNRVNVQLRALSSLGALAPDKPGAAKGRNITLLRYALAEGVKLPTAVQTDDPLEGTGPDTCQCGAAFTDYLKAAYGRCFRCAAAADWQRLPDGQDTANVLAAAAAETECPDG